MKRLSIAIGFAILLMSQALASEQSMLARVTVYWNSRGSGSQACWNGMRLRAGHCAVDPKRISYGSKVIFPDATCLAVDTGPDVVNRKAARRSGRNAAERNAIVVDRFFETKKEALSWTKAHPHFMTVKVVTTEKHSTPEVILHSATLADLEGLNSNAPCDLRTMFDTPRLSTAWTWRRAFPPGT